MKRHAWSIRKLVVLQSHSVLAWVLIGLIGADRLISTVRIDGIGVSDAHEQYRSSLSDTWQGLPFSKCRLPGDLKLME